MLVSRSAYRQWMNSRFPLGHGHRSFGHSSIARTAHVDKLPDWQLDRFRQKAFIPQLPIVLPYEQATLPQACLEWFIHEGNPFHQLSQGQPSCSELNPSFWSQHKDVTVPIELTGVASIAAGHHESTFHRHEAPLSILLAYLGDGTASSRSMPATDPQVSPSMYLAQCDLSSLPLAMQGHLPTPVLVRDAGRGDIYNSSLWLGRPPTYTPLHRDPNPNLFIQLAGRKDIRLFTPEVGNAIFDTVQEQLATIRTGFQGTPISASIRGEEMMQGPERQLLHQAVWGSEAEGAGEIALDSGHFAAYAFEARLGLGEALFIPKGWWHSVKGVGEGVTASANWWFR